MKKVLDRIFDDAGKFVGEKKAAQVVKEINRQQKEGSAGSESSATSSNASSSNAAGSAYVLPFNGSDNQSSSENNASAGSSTDSKAKSSGIEGKGRADLYIVPMPGLKYKDND